MKKITPFLMLCFLLNAAVAAENNPLLQPFDGLHGTPPFTRIKLEDYKPAFDAAIEETRREVDMLLLNDAIPNFHNTIEAYEFTGKKLTAISEIFFNLNEADTNDAMQELALELSPKLTALANDISLNPLLFDRVKHVYENTPADQLTTEQFRLLDKTYKHFIRNGAGLADDKKEIYRQLTTELAELSLKFKQNALAATNAFILHLTDEKQIQDLPSFVVEGAAAEASDRGLEGWVITLQAPSMVPFMTYSPNRELKEQLWRAYNTRCNGGEYDNTEIVKGMTDLRHQLANLLGYATYADYVLEERMAESSEAVTAFLDELLSKAIHAGHADVAAVQEQADNMGAGFLLMPWDFAYYSEKLKEEKYNLNEELTKPYFQLERVENGIFLLAEKLYGLMFRENAEIDVYHPDVKAFEVFDADGSFLAVLYMDYFPRASKRGGAWMTQFRSQSTENGVEVRPLISVVCNFTKPTENLPSLLTFNEVSTLLHEFGHALHGMLAEGHYPSLTGTSVYWDFVELPSQIMENWATEKEYLDLWAAHYETGEKIPADLVQRIKAAENFMSGYGHIRQVSFGLLDMAWHTITAPVIEPVDQFERKAMEPARVLPYIEGQSQSTAFGHIFAGGYAAGYYSYKWAEVLEADAFSLFREKGIFDKETAASFRENILSKGGTEHPMELYIRFRGHKPETQPLFDKLGIETK